MRTHILSYNKKSLMLFPSMRSQISTDVKEARYCEVYNFCKKGKEKEKEFHS